jgi:hypothetical protein
MKSLSSYEEYLLEAEIELSLAQQSINRERDLNQKMNDIREKMQKAEEKGDIHQIKKLRLMSKFARLQKALNDVNYQLKELSAIEKRKK